MRSQACLCAFATCLVISVSLCLVPHVSSARHHRALNQIFYAQPTAPPVAFASLSVQTAEANALISLRYALNNHPAFQGITLPKDGPFNGQTPVAEWALKAEGGIAAFMHVPCGTAQWAWVGCGANKRVVSINLDGSQMAAVNISWSQNNGDPLNGTIPWDALAVLTNLTYFNINYQTVSGGLTGIGNFSALQNLTLSRNLISGPIPDEVSRLKALRYLALDANQLTGPIPSSFANLKLLEQLVLGGNSLSGPFPSFVQNLTRLAYLDFSSNPIMGFLPDSWSSLTSLTALQIQMTTINGTIPPSWTKMKSLNYLSVASCAITATYPAALTGLTNIKSIWINNNKLYGQLPTNIYTSKLTSLLIQDNYFNGTLPPVPPTLSNSLKLSADGNCFANSSAQGKAPSVCTTFYQSLYYTAPPPATNNNTTLIIVLSIVIPLLALLLIGTLAFFFLRSRRNHRLSKLFTKGLRQTAREFPLSELKSATQNWSTVVGKGGYGTVYKAELKDGTFVAVKRLDQVSKQGDMEFIREVELLSRVHHRHLVNLLGFCAERGERALIYEYMAMGSLYEHIHGESAKSFPLSWDSRCKIAIHVALGIEYLHYGADPPLIHRDIKSANILLSDDGYSKVADFGLCKEAPIGAAADGSEQLVPTATAVRGSFGYLDPEYVNTSILSEKSDVYSYGVVLLELISGHKSIHDWQPLAYWAEEYLADREKTPLMVDPALDGNFDLDELYALCDIARTCVQDQSVNRPTIRDVAKALVENLGHGLTSFTGSQQDSASIVPSSTDATSMPSTTYTPSSNEASDQFSHQNYSETLHWTPNQSGQMSTKGGAGLTISTGAKGDRLPVPVPRRPDDENEGEDESSKEPNKKGKK